MDHFKFTKIADRVYNLEECYFEDSDEGGPVLVVGENKALLMDVGMGATGNVKEFAEKATGKPVICALSHGHPDHAGAIGHFDQVYVHDGDRDMLKWSVSKEKRMDAVMMFICNRRPELIDEVKAEMIDSSDVKTISMPDGMIFDLGGGIEVEVISVIGHTAGSVVFYYRKGNMLFVGDSIEPTTVYIGEGPEPYLPISIFTSELKKLRAKINDDTKVYCYHSNKPRTVKLIDDMIACSEKANSAEASKTEVTLQPFLAKKEAGREYYKETVGEASLVYDMESVDFK